MAAIAVTASAMMDKGRATPAELQTSSAMASKSRLQSIPCSCWDPLATSCLSLSISASVGRESELALMAHLTKVVKTGQILSLSLLASPPDMICPRNPCMSSLSFFRQFCISSAPHWAA
ncbi:hypothetical protein EGW08_014355, partial [Elysia chlorotica]